MASASGGSIRGVERVTTDWAAKRLGVTPRTLYRLIDERQLAVYRNGRKLHLDREEVERFAGGFDGDGGAFDRAPRPPIIPTQNGSMALDVPD